MSQLEPAECLIQCIQIICTITINTIDRVQYKLLNLSLSAVRGIYL
jgi:hypothetical protein